MRKRTRLQIQKIMTVCWETETVSKEKIVQQVSNSMSEKRLEHLLNTMQRKRYIYFNGNEYRAVIPREHFKYCFDILDSFKDDANPNVMMPSNGNLFKGGL